jgi:hypothetical protein
MPFYLENIDLFGKKVTLPIPLDISKADQLKKRKERLLHFAPVRPAIISLLSC